jgi:hypothetical protein
MIHHFTTETNWFLAVFAALAALALVMDWYHANEPIENAGDDFGFTEREFFKRHKN